MSFRLSALFVILALTGSASAQPIPFSRPNARFQASINGTVRDCSGRPVNGARVEIQDLMTGRTLTTVYTFANGSFEVRDLPPSRYEVVAIHGLTEASARIDAEHDREVNLTLPESPRDEKAGGRTVALSQMKVPGKARKLFQKALDAFRKSEVDDAFSFVQKALGMYPDYAQALTLRGMLNLQKGDMKSAQPDLEKAVELDYGDDTGFVALASLYNLEGKYDEAIRVLERGLRMHPDSWQALSELARAQLGKKEYESALQTLSRAEKFLPENIHYSHLFRAQAMVGLKNYTAAIAELETFLKKEPEGPNSDSARKTLGKLQAFELANKK